MSTLETPPGQSQNFVLTIRSFSSPNGRETVRSCLQDFLPFDPHDYQLEGVCQALDGTDLIAITATGDGKTGYFYMYIIAAAFFANNPAMCPPGSYFPKDPAIVVVCPTNSIEEQMEEKMKKLGLTAVAINANTLHKGRRQGENLWESVTEGVSMIMISPEQLTGEGFQKLLDNKVFWARVIALGADEIHLLPAWGALFRKAYQQVGFMRARFPDRVVAIGVTATMARGGALDTVRSMLGMQEGQFHCIRRSNFRPELQLLLRDLGTGINGRRFPALSWILKSQRKTVIYCATISLAFRVTSYLWTQAEDKTDLRTRLRMYTAINFPSYNSATRQILYEDPRPNITVATAAMAQGIDAPDIHDVVIVGEVADPDEAHQRWGRAGRDRQKVTDPRGIMYLTGAAVRKAKAVLEGKGKKTNQVSATAAKSSTPDMTEGMARVILAECLSAEQDRYYGNPRENPRCFCKTCSGFPPPTRSSTCNCSRCIPENLPPLPSMRSTKSSVGEPVHGSLQECAHDLLLKLRHDIWREADEYCFGSTPSAAFLPDITITYLLVNITAFTTVESLRPVVDKNYLLQPHLDRLLAALEEIRQMTPSTDDAMEACHSRATFDAEDTTGGVEHIEEAVDEDATMDEAVNTVSSEMATTSDRVSGVRDVEGDGMEQVGVEQVPSHIRSEPSGIPSHMCISWSIASPDSTYSGATTGPRLPSKRGASKPSSKRAGKRPRKQDNKENGQL